MRDFGFAFNDNDFSDRVLRIEITSDGTSDSQPDQCEGSDCVSNKKHKRMGKSQSLNTAKGDAAHSSDSDLECSTCVEVKTLHLSSIVLAEKSPFFYKLLKNGMRESQERHLTLRIIASEETALMDLLKFMYDNTLSATTTVDLLNVLMIADKFEVISCMTYCSELLKKLPISLESALLYLNLPSSVSMAEAVQSLKDAAKKYLVERYSDMEESQEDMMALPLYAVEVVLGSAGLQSPSEDEVFEFILNWARAHYPKLEERREILTNSLVQFICFPNLSSSVLKEVLVCPDFDHEVVSKLVLEALFFKVDAPYGQHILPSNDPSTTRCGSSERLYYYKLIKVVHFEHPQPRCVVYWDLKKQDCATPFPAGEGVLISQSFYLGGKCYNLWVECSHQQESSSNHFDLYVNLNESSGSCVMDMEFAAMKKRSKKFKSQMKRNKCTLTTDGSVGYQSMGCRDLFDTSWTNFMGDNSKYFIDGILHLRAELAIHESQP